jgi:hypothetical protein
MVATIFGGGACPTTDDTPAQSFKTEAASAPSRGMGAFHQ